MSKVIFAASQAKSPQATAFDAMAILWDTEDELVAETLKWEQWTYELMDLGFHGVTGPGPWVWEGVLNHRDADPAVYMPHWEGAFRRPTPYESVEIAAGRWPENKDRPRLKFRTRDNDCAALDAHNAAVLKRMGIGDQDNCTTCGGELDAQVVSATETERAAAVKHLHRCAAHSRRMEARHPSDASQYARDAQVAVVHACAIGSGRHLEPWPGDDDVEASDTARLQALLEGNDCSGCGSPPRLSCTNGVWRIDCMDCMAVCAEGVTIAAVCDDWEQRNKTSDGTAGPDEGRAPQGLTFDYNAQLPPCPSCGWSAEPPYRQGCRVFHQCGPNTGVKHRIVIDTTTEEWSAEVEIWKAELVALDLD